MGPHLEGIRDLSRNQMLPRCGSQGAGGDGRVAGDTPRPVPWWLLPAPAHSPAPANGSGSPSPPASTARCCPVAHSHLPRPSAVSRVGTGRDRDGGLHQLHSLPAAPKTLQHPQPHGHRPAALGPPNLRGSPSSISPCQPRGARGHRGMPVAEKGKPRRAFPPCRIPGRRGERLAWHPPLPAALWLDHSSAGPNQLLQRAPTGPGPGRTGLPTPCAQVPAGLSAAPQAPVPPLGPAPHLTPSLGVPGCPGVPCHPAGKRHAAEGEKKSRAGS